MKNLEQIRAANALEAATGTTFKGVNDGQVVKKVPTMIRENGILGAAAFALETGQGYEGVFNAIIRHLEGMPRLMPHESSRHASSLSLKAFIEDLSSADSARLRAITAEALAYLNYLRRFARKKEDEK